MAQRVAVVTGGGTGVGAAAAIALAEDGWTVLIAGRREDPLRELAGTHPDLDGHAESPNAVNWLA